jgi:hypothetical protein
VTLTILAIKTFIFKIDISFGGNAKKGKAQREMDRWNKTEHDKPWTERRGY